MSFVISEKQYLATTEKRSSYRPLIVEDMNIIPNVIDVNFGHPLYSSVCDIYAVECTGDEPIKIPIIPDGCVSIVFKGKNDCINCVYQEVQQQIFQSICHFAKN